MTAGVLGAGEAVQLRPARLDDLPLIEAWDEDPDVIAAGGDWDFDWEIEIPRVLPWRDLLIAEEGGRPVGFMQIIDPSEEESHYWGEIEPGLRALDIWIGAAADRGRGLGTRMMQLAEAYCFRQPDVAAIVIDPLASNTAAHRFYQSLGFRPVGRRTFGDGDDCLVLRLERSVWESHPKGAITVRSSSACGQSRP